MSSAPLAVALADRYRIERELGVGGMATVYLAEDVRHRRRVALKVLHPELSAVIGPERFLKEIELTANLQHPHILPLFDSGDADGQLFYVMPFVDGETLRARLDREKQLPIADVLQLAREVADALQYAHQRGVIHRDIKPENILLQGGHALVADFGIALAVQSAGGQRLTQTGLSLGTPQYMSPEQAMGEKTVDARADIYALGAVVYEMLVGEPPFTGPTAQAIVARVLTSDPVAPDAIRKTVPAWVSDTVLMALAKLPADRPTTAAAFALALTDADGARRAEANGRITTRLGTRVATRAPQRLPMIGGAVALLITGLAAGWFARPVARDRQPFADVQPIRLTHAGAVGCAAIAPGGQEFAAIIGTFDDETDCGGTLVVRPLPTGADQVLASGVRGVSKIQWSPNGDAVLLAGAPAGKSAGVWIFPTRTGVARQLLTGLAFPVGFLDARHVFVGTGNVAASSNTSGAAMSTVVRVLDVESGGVTDSVILPTTPDQADGSFSPSGRWFALTMRTPVPRVYLVSRAGRVTDSVPGVISDVTWMGNARVIYYRSRNWGPGDVVVQSVDPATGRFAGDAAVIWSALPSARSFTSDSTGRRLMAVLRPMTDELHLMRLPDATTSRMLVRSLNAYLGDPKLSPDGRHVAYSRQDALGSNVYMVNLDDGVERALSSDTLSTMWINWLNAQQILRSTPQGALLSVDLATGRVRRISPPAGEALVTAANNTWLFRPDRASSLVRRDSLLAEQVLTRPPGVGQSSMYTVSATGSHVAQAGVTTDDRKVFSVFNTATAAWSSLTPLDSGFRRLATVASDGTVYLSRFNGRTELWRSRNGAAASLYAKLPVHCYDGSVAVSDDGRSVVCNVTTNLPDAWLVHIPDSRR